MKRSTWQSLSLVEKEALRESREVFELAEAQITGLVNLVFYLQTGFTSARIPFFDKPMVITEPAVQLYLSNTICSVDSCRVFLKYHKIE